MRGLALGAAMLAVLFAPLPALAQTPTERGLLITPPRQYLEADPGKTIKSSIAVANLTDAPLDIGLHAEQFSVADYTYEYQFDQLKEDWVKLEQAKVTLKKTESRTIPYSITLPSDARPGGHYFTVFASAKLAEGRQVRAATVIYLTASGDITKHSKIISASVPVVSFGGGIPFAFDVQNSGNTHVIIYAAGRIQGLLPFPSVSSGEIAHVVLPDKIRTISGDMQPPALPGVYRAEYGYKDEDGNSTWRSSIILYMPPWAIALMAGLMWFGILLFKRRREKPSTDSSPR